MQGRAGVGERAERGSSVGVVDWAGKVRSIASTANALMKHTALIAALGLWSRIAKVTNMNTERDLATVRRCTPKNCHADRFLCTGFLGLVLRCHRNAGGDDPRLCTRAELKAKKAPLACVEKDEQAQHPAKRRKRVDLRNGIVSEAKAACGGRFPDRGAYLEACKRGTEIARTMDPNAITTPSPTAADVDKEYDEKAIKTLWGTSSRMHPFREDAALAAAAVFDLKTNARRQEGSAKR